MRNIGFLLIFLITPLFLTAVEPINVYKKAEANNFQPFENRSLGYSLSIPKGWEIRRDLPHIDLIAVNQLTGQNVSVTVTKKTNTKETLNDFVENWIHGFTDGSGNTFEIVKRGNIQLDHSDALWIMLSGNHNQSKVRDLFYITYANNHFYLIAFASIEEEFSLSQSLFDDILQSVKFRNPEIK